MILLCGTCEFEPVHLLAISGYWRSIMTSADALQLTEIHVPEVVDVKETATLSCTYELGKHKLNSVKWYKNGMEFFRYVSKYIYSHIHYISIYTLTNVACS